MDVGKLVEVYIGMTVLPSLIFALSVLTAGKDVASTKGGVGA